MPKAMSSVENEVLDLLNDLHGGDPAPQADPEPKPAEASAQDPAPVAQDPAPVAQPKEVVEQPKEVVEQKPLIPEDILKTAATQAPADPAADGNTEDPPDPPDVKPGTKAAYAWQALKSEKKRIATELAEAKAALEAAKAQPSADPEEVATLRSQLTEYEQKLGQYDLSATTEFKQRFEVPIQQGVRKGQSLLQRAGKSPEEAEAIMRKLSDPSLTLEQVQDLVADEPIAIQGALVNLSSDLGEMQAQREAAIGSWKETRAALQVQEQRNMEVRLSEDIEAGTKVALDTAIKEGNWMLQPSTDQNWNAQVQQRIDAVKGIVKSGNKAEIIKWIMEGITAKPLRELLTNVHNVAEQRKAELDNLVSRSPRLSSGDGRQPAPSSDGKPKTPQQVVDEMFGGADQQNRFR